MKKKTLCCVYLLASSLLLGACSSSASSSLEKTSDTTLNYWIGEMVSDEDKAKMTLIPNYMGGMGEYLDADYSALEDGGDKSLPVIHVSYLITDSSDITKEGNYVTSISCTDPKVTVYGLTINSNEDEVTTRMKGLGFSLSCEECTGNARGWYKGHDIFFIGEGKIGITSTYNN